MSTSDWRADLEAAPHLLATLDETERLERANAMAVQRAHTYARLHGEGWVRMSRRIDGAVVYTVVDPTSVHLRVSLTRRGS